MLYPNCSEYTIHLKATEEEILFARQVLDTIIDKDNEEYKEDKISNVISRLDHDSDEQEFIEEDIVDTYNAIRNLIKVRRENKNAL